MTLKATKWQRTVQLTLFAKCYDGHQTTQVAIDVACSTPWKCETHSTLLEVWNLSSNTEKTACYEHLRSLYSSADVIRMINWEGMWWVRHAAHKEKNRNNHKEKSNKMQQCVRIFIIPYLYVSGDTTPIIRSLKLHWQPLVFHTWKFVGRVAGGR